MTETTTQVNTGSSLPEPVGATMAANPRTGADRPTVTQRIRAGAPPLAALLDWAPRPTGLSFVRHIDVPYEQCRQRLVDWGRQGDDGVISVGRSRLIIPHDTAAGADGGRNRLEVGLARGPLRPRLRMDLEIVRWSPAFGTVLELHPENRGLRPDTRYFREGHALLDRLTEVVTGQR